MRLLSTIRTVEHQNAARELAAANASEQRAKELAARTDRMALEYFARIDASSALELAAQRRMASQLVDMGKIAERNARNASDHVAKALEGELSARLRRDRVNDLLQTIRKDGTILE